VSPTIFAVHSRGEQPSYGMSVCRGFQPETISAAAIVCTPKTDVIFEGGYGLRKRWKQLATPEGDEGELIKELIVFVV